jgi:hypothetical protein
MLIVVVAPRRLRVSTRKPRPERGCLKHRLVNRWLVAASRGHVLVVIVGFAASMVTVVLTLVIIALVVLVVWVLIIGVIVMTALRVARHDGWTLTRAGV